MYLATRDHYRDGPVTWLIGDLGQPDAGIAELRACFPRLVEAFTSGDAQKECLMSLSAIDLAPDLLPLRALDLRLACSQGSQHAECLAALVDTSIGGARFARELDRIAELRGYLCLVVSDNHCPAGDVQSKSAERGTALTSNAMLKWQEDRKVGWHDIASRCRAAHACMRERGQAHEERSRQKLQWQNARGEPQQTPVPVSSSIGLEPMAPSMDDPACRMTAPWHANYNHHRPHSSLAGLTPHEYAKASNEDQNLNRANP